MTDIMSVLYEFYIMPQLETDEAMAEISALYQEIPPAQKERCEWLLERCACQAFLLGVRAGAGLEQFLKAEPLPGQPH